MKTPKTEKLEDVRRRLIDQMVLADKRLEEIKKREKCLEEAIELIGKLKSTYMTYENGTWREVTNFTNQAKYLLAQSPYI